MRLIQSRNILLTCQEIERSCICVLHARYRFCFSLQCFYWIKGNVPTVWYLCSDSVVFVFRQCGIGFWFSFHFWKNPIFGSSPKNASHCIQSYTVKHGQACIYIFCLSIEVLLVPCPNYFLPFSVSITVCGLFKWQV